MFGSDKRSGFLSGVTGGLKTAKKKNVSAPVSTPAPRQATPTSTATPAATPTRTRRPAPSIVRGGAAPAGTATPGVSTANSGTGYMKATPGIQAQIGRAVNLGQGNNLNAQVTPGKWFQKFR